MLKCLFLDDAKQRMPTRERMGALVGVGGMYLDSGSLGGLERAIDGVCSDVGFPSGEIFKWSPSKRDWMRENLIERDREGFFRRILGCCSDYGAKAIVAVCDTSKRKANSRASDHEIDAFLLSVERFHTAISPHDGAIFIAKPSGGTKSENKMLAECVEHRMVGTDFVDFSRLAMNPITMPISHSRILQASDLVVSISTAMCAGNVSYAESLFKNSVLPMFISDWRGLIGNTGLKFHPNVLYRNVYHWILDEVLWANGGTGFPLPDVSRPYCVDPLRY